MKSIHKPGPFRESVRDVIERRILPWIERDGISNLLLPEQIKPKHCARPIKCKRECETWHREHELGIGLTGETTYCVDKKRLIIKPGRIVFLTGGTVHGSDHASVHFTDNLDPNKPSSSLWLRMYPFGVLVQVSHMNDKTDTMTGTLPYLLPGRHFDTLITCLLEEVRTKSADYADIGRCLFMEFLHRCRRATTSAVTVDKQIAPSYTRLPVAGKASPKQASDRVRAAQDFIHSHYHAPIDLDDIAEAAEASITHLTRQFKSATGLPPVQYLLNVRMAAAEQLLLTDLKISEVAHMVGIEDPYYFSRLFRRHGNISPLQYRRNMVEAIKRSSAPAKSHKVK